MVSSVKPYVFWSLLVVFALVAAAPAQAQDGGVTVERAFPNVAFNIPLGIRFPNDVEDRIYVAESAGRVMVMDNDPEAQEASVFLDITERIASTPPGQIFAVEFHPNYAENGYVFLRYRLDAPQRNRLSRFTRSEDNPLEVDIESEIVLIEVETSNNFLGHYAGGLGFGPDGYLYVPWGDAGEGEGQGGDVQDLSLLLGKVLRLDVDNPVGDQGYGIPPSNPFVGNTEGWREEIYALGFRNPWQMSIDQATGDVLVADVGRVAWEEVNKVENGQNYGWPIMEGAECAPFGPPTCDQEGLTPPVWAYPRGNGAAVVGGYVYHGDAIPDLDNLYLYGDFVSRQVWAIDLENPTEADPLFTTDFNFPSFGEDRDGELYLTHYSGEGYIYKIVPAGTTDAADGPASSRLRLSVYPQPSAGSVNFAFESEAGLLRLTVHDLLGREVARVVEETVGPETRRTVAFDTGRLARGMYIVRLEGDGEAVSEKLIVAK